MNTWWTVMEMVLGDETKKSLTNIDRGLEVIAQSEMPPAVVAEAGRLMMEIDQLQAKLKRLNDEVAGNMEHTMWPVL